MVWFDFAFVVCFCVLVLLLFLTHCDLGVVWLGDFYVFWFGYSCLCCFVSLLLSLISYCFCWYLLGVCWFGLVVFLNSVDFLIL